MISKNKPIEIPEENIFKNDTLDRKEAIENLSELITSTTEALTISVNADWGAGKTTFVKLWKKYLEKNKGVKAIYFSAWENDFLKEPLISILGEMYEAFPKEEKTLNKIGEIAGKIVRRSVLPAVLKAVTAGSVGNEEITG